MNADEQWAAVPGYEGAYEVSDLGRVRSLDRVIQRVDGRPGRKYRGRILSPWTNPQGQSFVNLSADGRQRLFSVPELVLTAFVGPKFMGSKLRYGSGGSDDHRLINLRWARSDCCPRDHRLVQPNLTPAGACLACTRARSSHQFEHEANMHYAAIMGWPWGLAWARQRGLTAGVES